MILESPRFSRMNPFGLRAYLAGGGATIALTAAAAFAFLAITALVSFSGLPFGFGGGDNEAVPIPPRAPVTGYPESAALVAGLGASGAVAGGAAADSAIRPAPGADRSRGGGSDSPGGDAAAGTTPPGASAPGGDAESSSGTLGGTVQSVEQTAGNLGLDAPLGDLTRGVTEPVDKTLNQTLNGVGGLIGNPKLGDEVNSGVNGVTGKLLP